MTPGADGRPHDISVTDRGFLGKTEDSSTDLVLLDARFYDPSIGKFLSPDPILELSEPQLANPYGYAGNNPETFADPTGLSVRCPSWLPAALCTMLNSIPQWAIDGFFGAVRSFLENNTAVIAAQLALQAFGVGGPLDWMSQLEGIFGVNRNSTAYKVGSVAATIISWAGVGGVMNLLGKGLKEGAEFLSKRLAAQQAEKLAARKAAQKAAARRAEAAAAASERRAAAAARRKARAEAKATSKATRSRGGTHKSSASTRGGSKSRSGSRCSFPPGTLVLMADGSRRPIEQLKVGDKVLATDPVTSVEGAHAVTATTGYKADKHMVEISIKPKSAKAGNGDTITATDNHPFWVQNRHAWLQAGRLQPGMWLRTSAGTWVQISAIKTWTSQQQEVHNLTVADLHTYYVLAGVTPVLVHNCGLKPGEQHVYRAVQEKERRQIHKTRRYENVPGIESKYFSSTPEGAAQYAKAAYGKFPQEGPYTLTRGVIRSDAIPAESRIESLADGGGGIDDFALGEDAMNAIGRVRIMPYMPIP
ncbi:polymorphic toxin-type HINT domain-containing protein [Microbispora sp. H10885]|uniref:polymorphic toxin-type HINT domain-containing protein n=1 Tax=Microbispora sp. H10885 TaxID=2729110 RepID=UPI0016005E87|nr:polymorphic toxin-type HINT domain-containing protein [Microbispora sp. H10885]